MEERLENCTYQNTAKFIPNVNIGKVIRIVDGDTLDIATCVDNKIVKFRVRLAGIDTPEMRSKKGNEKKYALESKKALASLVDGKIVNLKDVEWGMFGRLVCRVFYNNLDICQFLLDNKYANEYKGKRDKNFDWDRYKKEIVTIEFVESEDIE